MRAATTDISLHAVDDLLVGWLRIFAEQSDCGHDHARGAVRALERFDPQKSLLHGMQVAVLFESFDGRNFLSHDSANGSLAGARRSAIEQHRASATHAFTAAVLGSGEAEILAEDVKQL